MRKSLSTFDHFFVQEENSEALLQSIQLNNITISGDTRFDRVSHQIEINNRLDFMDAFLGQTYGVCIVCGSTWIEDEEVLLAYINKAPSSIKFVIAPHKIETKLILQFQKKLKRKSSVRYSEFKTGASTESSLAKTNVLIVDTVGFLTKIYSYADIAYVGGAMGTSGLHNILEPATFGVPVIIGKEYSKFPEASKLRSLAGLFSVSTKEECTTILNKLADNSSFRNKTGMICGHWINSNTGATKIVVQYLIDTIFPKN
jgi:3-deoxy-D-manno-octulosonic-acid transferase